jgi:hypothetical protein
MELITVANPIEVVGLNVETFPEGIGKTFEVLLNHFDTHRSYYGISYCKNGVIHYMAAAEKKAGDNVHLAEARNYLIEKGKYLSEAVWDWRKNISDIKDVFHSLMQDVRVKSDSTCIEWYKDDKVMWCMIRIE